MSKRLIMLLAFAFVIGVTCAAFAEVQNVKVSGDITAMGVARDNLDLAKIPSDSAGSGTTTLGTDYYGSSATSGVGDKAKYFGKERDLFSIARIRVDADLTDNVSASVRLLNERQWNGEGNNAGEANTNVALYNTVSSESKIDLDLAYVTMKEFLYSPLTLTIGRQLLRFGNGFIVGDPDTNIFSSVTNLAEGDLSARKSFDAIRATFDYNPLVVDVLYAKIEEGQTNLNDDVNLSGINASYDLAKHTTLEGFFFAKIRGNQASPTYNLDAKNATTFGGGTTTSGWNAKVDQVYAVGARVVNKFVKDLTVDLQGAYQFGEYNPKYDPNAAYRTYPGPKAQMAESGNRHAWAAELDLAYDLKDISVVSKYKPVIGLNYAYFSGADRDRATGSYKGWDPMFEDQTVGHLMNAIFAQTNMHRIAASLSGKVTDDFGVKVDYVTAMFDRRYPEGRLAVLSGLADSDECGRSFRMGKQGHIGQEFDLTLTYDYTEDVQFGLLAGVFVPGGAINDGDYLPADTSSSDALKPWPRKKSAGEVIGSMKVTF